MQGKSNGLMIFMSTLGIFLYRKSIFLIPIIGGSRREAAPLLVLYGASQLMPCRMEPGVQLNPQQQQSKEMPPPH